MSQEEIAPVRSSLEFVPEVERAFEFLTRQFGFRIVRLIPPTFVRYESETVFLNVYHGRVSYEINVEIGRLSHRHSREFVVQDVLGAMDRDVKRAVYFQASNPEGVRHCVGELGRIVAERYGPLLGGDEKSFAFVEAHVREVSATVTRKYAEGPTREAAERAWHDKDYSKVRELYGSIREGLTSMERRRLAYAEKQSSPGDRI